MKKGSWLVTLCMAAFLAGSAGAATQAAAGLAPTPPMGWNDWNAFGCKVSAELVKQTAKALVDSGLAAAGYRYVNIDDCWMAGSAIRSFAERRAAGRDAATGQLIPDPVHFPEGIKPLADYVHALGLKLGIYESAGVATCQGLAGSYGHELTDARTFAAWGIDYLKYDNCGASPGTADNQDQYIARYQAMGDALRQASAETGHPIVYSVCEWGKMQPWLWAAERTGAQLWRTTKDIADTSASTVALFKENVVLAEYARPGAWNDPDMLEIGNGHQTGTEYRAQFSLWAMMAAPLIIGTPLTTASPETLAILGNREVIAVDQDSLGRQAKIHSHTGSEWILTRPLGNGDQALLFFNEGDSTVEMSISLRALLGSKQRAYRVRDLWSHEDSKVSDTLRARIPAHGVAMFRSLSSSLYVAFK